MTVRRKCRRARSSSVREARPERIQGARRMLKDPRSEPLRSSPSEFVRFQRQAPLCRTQSVPVPTHRGSHAAGSRGHAGAMGSPPRKHRCECCAKAPGEMATPGGQRSRTRHRRRRSRPNARGRGTQPIRSSASPRMDCEEPCARSQRPCRPRFSSGRPRIPQSEGLRARGSACERHCTAQGITTPVPIVRSARMHASAGIWPPSMDSRVHELAIALGR